MKKIVYFTIVLFSLPFLGLATTYSEVIFENSLVNGSYAKSTVAYQGNSWVENLNMRLLVSDSVFFTPGNALSLKYLSVDKGNWNVKINYNRARNHYRFNANDILSFFVYIKSKDTQLQDLPKVYISLHNGATDTLSLDKYIPKIVYGKWIQVRIPSKNFKNITKESNVTGVGFVQHRSSEVLHHIYLDQLEFLPSKFVEVKLNAPAILTDAIPYDRMVHLKWQSPLSPSIRYVKLYRSLDGKDFKAVGIRPIYMQSCLDMVPKVGEKYYYKIVWLDYNYNESPASAVKEAETKPLNDKAIVDLVQATHVNYFVENFDINSGMYMPFRSKDKAIVSTKGTAGAILSLIVGVENKQVSRNVLLQRVSKIAYFLLKAQNNNGIFPAYFDGRKAIPEYIGGNTSYDVRATAMLVEALLIARTYFDGDDEVERDLRTRITSLYNQINWKAIADKNMLLKPNLAIAKEVEHTSGILPLFGVNEAINTYLLALSSAQYALPTNSYFDAVYHKYGLEHVEHYETFDIYTDSLLYSEPEEINTSIRFLKDSLVKYNVFEPVLRYGVQLPLGEYNASLMELYKPFMTIRPTIVSDSLVNWPGVLNSYVNYVKRRDNESGVGAYSADIWGFYQHRDTTSNYRINPAVGPSAVVVDKELGLSAILALYKLYADVLLGDYGFRAWLDLKDNDESDEYFAMNQSTLVVMLENAKSGLIWGLYEKIPELKNGRDKLFLKPTLLVD